VIKVAGSHFDGVVVDRSPQAHLGVLMDSCLVSVTPADQHYFILFFIYLFI
jgi:hypothetical protein